jgi:hypothetical protein
LKTDSLFYKIFQTSPDLQSQIRQLSASQLEDLAEALLDFSTKEDLVAWLQR